MQQETVVQSFDMKKHPVLFQGIAGAYSEAALLEYAKLKKLSFIPQAQEGFFKELFEGIANKTKLGWIPIENSTHGMVVESIDLLREYDFVILGSHTYEVDHCLCAPPESKLSGINEAYSHPQALGQCRDFLFANQITAQKYPDTAGAAQYVAELNDMSVAAICSERAAKLYGLKVLKKEIQDVKGNTTRFLLVKTKRKNIDFQKKLEQGRVDVTTTVLFETKDIPAALYKCLGGFATNAVNLLRIESRPSRKKDSRYFFLIDLEGHPDDPLVEHALDELRVFAREVRILGSY